MLNNAKVYKILAEHMSEKNEKKLTETIEKLSKKGFDLNFHPEDQPSLLELSHQRCCYDLFERLIQIGANYNVDLVDFSWGGPEYEVGFLQGGYYVHPKIADKLVSCGDWDLFKRIIDDCELCLDGTLYKTFQECIFCYKFLTDKKFFQYYNTAKGNEIPELVNEYKKKYQTCTEILRRLSERFNIDPETYELCSSDPEFRATLKDYCAPFPYNVFDKALYNRLGFGVPTPKTEKANQEYLKTYDRIMSKIKQSENTQSL